MEMAEWGVELQTGAIANWSSLGGLSGDRWGGGWWLPKAAENTTREIRHFTRDVSTAVLCDKQHQLVSHPLRLIIASKPCIVAEWDETVDERGDWGTDHAGAVVAGAAVWNADMGEGARIPARTQSHQKIKVDGTMFCTTRGKWCKWTK